MGKKENCRTEDRISREFQMVLMIVCLVLSSIFVVVSVNIVLDHQLNELLSQLTLALDQNYSDLVASTDANLEALQDR